MNFIRQIGYEIKNILRSKFILIIAILVLAASFTFPILGFLTERANKGYPIGPMPIAMERDVGYAYYGGHPDSTEEPIIIDGVTIKGDNPLYWEAKGLQEEMENMKANREMFSRPEIMDLTLSMMEEELKYHVKFAEQVHEYGDYRFELHWHGVDSIYDKFIYEHHEVPIEDMLEALQTRRGYDIETYKTKYIDITSEERLKAIEEIDGNLNVIFQILSSNDFPKFIEFRIGQEEKNIADLEKNIQEQEELIIKNPLQEENINTIIEDMRKQIGNIKENAIPMLMYRSERNIIPGEDRWENNAIMSIEENRNQLLYTEILKEEDFRKDQYYMELYGTYQKYVKAMNDQMDGYNNKILIAERSLEEEKPDMSFVYSGARYRTVEFLTYATLVSIFGVLIGGWLIASEFQQGTIRLLMIRPKTRTKILLSKFFGALVITFGIYIAGSLLNAITNGIIYGFADFKYPNYTIGGEIGFLPYYLPKLLASSVSIIFIYVIAFMFSVWIKNVAVAMIIPIVGFVGSTILLEILSYSGGMRWLVYTPVPFMQISSFFTNYSTVGNAIERGINISLAYGIGLLTFLMAVFMMISIIIFKRRDILN